jgi:hypothetical protein
VSSERERQVLDSALLDWMQEPEWQLDEARFEALALELFAHQFGQCPPYGRFARGRGLTPETVKRWRDIPAVPAGAFKELPLRSFPEPQTSKTFRTSGTSGQKRGELHLDTLALYEASLMASLDTLLIPDRADSKTTLRILAPSGREAPDSSLSHMFQVLVARRGSPDSAFDVVDGELRLESLIRGLETVQSTGAPLVLCGTAFSFVHLLDALEARSLAFRCPGGSRIMETGGFKGRSREMSRAELYAALTHRLGVPAQGIVNQYGMTELGSQFYDSVWTDPAGPRRKLGPPWARVRFLDPETGRETEPGEPGMVVIHDLANTGSVAAIQTADLGRAVLDGEGAPIGFEILGRHPGAEARGCSIAADEMLSRSA